MQALKVLIIEDDIVLASELEEQLLDFGYSIVDSVSNDKDALLAFRRRLPDLVLCDIHLEGSELDGIEIAKAFNAIARVPIIFLTAFGDAKTVARAKEISPAYYLIKPCNPTQLKVAIDFGLQNFTENKEASIDHSLKKHSAPENNLYSTSDFFFVKKGHKYLRLDINEIVWVEALGSNVKIVTNGHNYSLAANLSSFSKQLPHEFLVRVHRSYIINIQKVVSFFGGTTFVKYKGQEKEIPIGKTYRDDFQDLVHKLSSD